MRPYDSGTALSSFHPTFSSTKALQHSVLSREMQKSLIDKIYSFIYFLETKHILERQSGEQEIKALKDEIRSLHVSLKWI